MANVALRVAVVGGGYAGMAAAVTLASGGAAVTVFEAGPVVGGRARRIRISSGGHGHELDNGQHILVGAYVQLFALMRTVEVPARALLRLPLEIRYASGFSLRSLGLPQPLGLALGVLLAKGVPFAERRGAIRFLRRMRARRFAVDSGKTVGQLLREQGQHGAMGRHLWGPLCVAALNTPLEQASARVFLAVLRDTLAGRPDASDLVLPRRDLSKLFPEPAAEFVRRRGGEVRLRAPVADIVELKRAFDAVIVAVGPHQLKGLLPGAAPEYGYQPIYTCYLQYAERVGLPFPMLGLSGGLVQWVFDRGALLGERGRLACVISAEGTHQDMSLDALCDRCHAELAETLPNLGKPHWSRAIAEKRATVACVPGLARPPVETSYPGVFLAGDYTDPEYPPTLEAAARSGVRAARKVLAAGFSIVELVVVIAVLAVLAALAVPRYFDLRDEAARASVAQHAAAFGASVQNVRIRYAVNGASGNVDNLAGFGDGTVDTNANGYPTDTAGANTIPNNAAGATRCRNVFLGLLSAPPAICGGGIACNSTHVFQASTAGAQVCRYNYVKDPAPARFFTYDASTGAIALTNP